MKKAASELNRRDFLKKTCLTGTALAACGLFNGIVPPLSFAGQSREGACGKIKVVQETRLLMGTVVTLTALSSDSFRAEAAFLRAFTEMERLIAVFNRHDSASALSVLNAEGFLASAPPELLAVLRESARLGNHTGQAFNPAVAPVLELFETGRTAGSGAVPNRPPHVDHKEFSEALALARPGGIRANGGSVRLERNGMRLTLDGIAKGYIADEASRCLSSSGLGDHMVNAGGDIKVSGYAKDGRPWFIGIQDPVQPGRVVDRTAAVNCGIATSGSYENYFDRSRSRHHLISPFTGQSPDLAGVTVKAPSAMQADALATALALMPPAQAVRYIDARADTACLIIGRRGQRYTSGNWS